MPIGTESLDIINLFYIYYIVDGGGITPILTSQPLLHLATVLERLGVIVSGFIVMIGIMRQSYKKM